jgi:Protein of unknown function (DUF1493)
MLNKENSATIKEINLAKLRHAYKEVTSFIEHETHEKIYSLKTCIAKDLILHGDDNVEFLARFIEKYKLNAANFNYATYFHTEHELYGSEQTGYNLIKLVMYIFLTIICVLTFGRVSGGCKKLDILMVQRPVKDLTIGDMITWYLEKDFMVRENLRYEMKINA